ALLEAQQKELGKVTRAREDLEQREHRFDTAKAEFEARAKAVEQREKRLKTQSDALERERAESKTMLKQLEVEGERVSQKEAGAGLGGPLGQSPPSGLEDVRSTDRTGQP